METEQYLSQKVDGYAQLTKEERHAIDQFSLIWALFENAICATRATQKLLVKVPRDLAEIGHLDISAFESTLAYFRARYFHAGETTTFFKGLHLDEGSPKYIDLVKTVVSGAENSDIKVLGAMLLIIHRYRNNLFHGVKMQYGISGQRENFEHACNVLMAVMDQYPRVDRGQRETA